MKRAHTIAASQLRQDGNVRVIDKSQTKFANETPPYEIAVHSGKFGIDRFKMVNCENEFTEYNSLTAGRVRVYNR